MVESDLENPNAGNSEPIGNAIAPKNESKWSILKSSFSKREKKVFERGVEENVGEKQVQETNFNSNPYFASENGVQRVKTAIEEDLEYIEKDFDNEEGLNYGDSFPNVMIDNNSNMIFELEDAPETGPLFLCAFQQILFFLSSLILIPHLLVDKMNGSDYDKAMLISSVMMLSGLSTVLNLYFGIRISLLHGPNLIYLIPALSIISYAETEDVFEEKIKEIMGAVIVASIFQIVISYFGILKYFIELVNPVVMSATILTAGLSFIQIGFFKAAKCVEIGLPEIIIFIIFFLYFRRTYHCTLKFLQINAIPLSLLLTWFYAHMLTVSGSYDFNGCDFSSSGLTTLTPKCSNSLVTRQQCKTDVSDALQKSDWIRFPYPFQYGKPIFKFESAIVYVISFVIVMVDSASTYHSTASLVISEPPPLVCVERGIGMEGVCSLFAGMWGIGSGLSPLIENVHNLAVTQVASRIVFALASAILILLSIIGKVGGLLATIPPSMIGGLLCISACMIMTVGFSNLRYTVIGSSRNSVIIALSTFLSLSVSSYFEQYDRSANHGPVNSNNNVFNKVLNTLFSESMVVAFFLSFVLDSTVPADFAELSRYVWAEETNPRFWLPCFWAPPQVLEFDDLTADQAQVLAEAQETEVQHKSQGQGQVEGRDLDSSTGQEGGHGTGKVIDDGHE